MPLKKAPSRPATPSNTDGPAKTPRLRRPQVPASKHTAVRDPKKRAELLRRAFAAMAAIPDDPPGSDEAFMKAIDEGRPNRPVFKGYY
ncbi:hypothetical protein P12x_000057 [Tundrisphaera lichenicola]|uniref:hypothetical protein n=1 Tax=Tundrisphaera lichenicola TaxID=2029860 RepID=UPI003EC0989D